MLKNYFLVALRNLLRNPALSLIHITGFGLGIAAFLFAIQTVIFEFSFDNFHTDGDKIFNVPFDFVEQERSQTHFLSATPALYHQIKAQMPEVEFVTRYNHQSNREPYCVITYTEPNGKQKSYNEANAQYVDEDFLKVFDFPLLRGNRENALDGTTSLVMTKSVAQKYFGNEDPLGKVLEISTGGPETRKTKFTYYVTGVLEDIPANSSLQFDVLLPFRNFEENYIQDLKNIWFWPGFFTFVKTREIEDPVSLGFKINRLVPVEERERMAGLNQSLEFKAQRLADLHFTVTNLERNSRSSVVTNSKIYTVIIGTIGLVILIVAGVNYVNLTTAKSLKRAKEVGIRKAIGASPSQLVRQFLLDALLFNALGFAFAVTLLQLGRPLIEIWGAHSFTVFDFSYSQLVLCIFILAISTVLSGIIPAILLTRIECAKALKGISLRASGGGLLRKGLVVFQFVVSVSLIVFTFAIFLQVKHMQSKEKGFEAEQRIVIKSVGTEDFDFSKYRFFKDRIELDPKILSATAAESVPGLLVRSGTQYSRIDQPNERIRLFDNVVDFDFVKTMGMTLLAGNEFTKERMTGERVVMINETSVTQLGYSTPDEAIGKTLTFIWQGAEGNMVLKIIGVVKNFNFESPGNRSLPQIFMFANTTAPYTHYNYFIVHVAPGQHQETVAFLEQEWKKAFPQAPFEYTFQDQAFQKVFERDERTKSIAGLSTVLAIFIACMGLGGLVAYSVSQRQKEIGIRKALGASVSRILVLLSGDFVQLIFISMVLAIPIAWIAVNKFLENYEYRIQPSFWMFVIPCLLLLLIAIVTMGYQTVRAARSNPVDALKNE